MTRTMTKPASAPSATDVRNVLVIGGGQMGSGIAQVFAAAGRSVWVHDVSAESLERGRAGVASSAGRLRQKDLLTDEQVAGIESISWITDLGQAAVDDLHLAIEAIVEDVPTKLDVLGDLDRRLPAEAILASNTSSISITLMAAATSRPERVVGMHFMNPPPMLELVEVVAGLQTSPGVVDTIAELATDLGKVPVRAADAPGFITNRILMPMINEAFFCLHEGVGSAEDIDQAMKLGMRHPLGPLALADLIGLDTCLAIMRVLHHDLGDDKYRPCPLLRRYVDAGRLGRKCGAGVYTYGDR